MPSRTASSSPASVKPRLEPPELGLIASGRPRRPTNSPACALGSATLEISSKGGVGRPSAIITRLAAALFIASAPASTPEPT